MPGKEERKKKLDENRFGRIGGTKRVSYTSSFSLRSLPPFSLYNVI